MQRTIKRLAAALFLGLALALGTVGTGGLAQPLDGVLTFPRGVLVWKNFHMETLPKQ
jgi:hypothetical protein